MIEAISYDDVLLLPQHSDVHSRADVRLDTSLVPGWTLSIPIIAANMKTVTGPEMAYAMSRLGGIAFLPRFNDVNDAVADYRWVVDHKEWAVPSIGLEDWVRLEAHMVWGAKTFCIDVAHG